MDKEPRQGSDYPSDLAKDPLFARIVAAAETRREAGVPNQEVPAEWIRAAVDRCTNEYLESRHSLLAPVEEVVSRPSPVVEERRPWQERGKLQYALAGLMLVMLGFQIHGTLLIRALLGKSSTAASAQDPKELQLLDVQREEILKLIENDPSSPELRIQAARLELEADHWEAARTHMDAYKKLGGPPEKAVDLYEAVLGKGTHRRDRLRTIQANGSRERE